MNRIITIAAMFCFAATSGCKADSAHRCPDGTDLRRAKVHGQLNDICVHLVGYKIVLNGPIASWHDNGNKKSEGMYREGKEVGEFKQWSKENKVLGTFTMIEGTGTWSRWHENGRKAEEIEQKDGQAHGSFVMWHENGKKAEEGTNEAGKRRGVWTRWDEDGKVIKVRKYKAVKKNPDKDEEKKS